MYQLARSLWGLVAVGAAAAVGVATRDPGFTALTFLGSLVLPRVLGLYPRRWDRRAMRWHGGCGGGSQQAPTQTV